MSLTKDQVLGAAVEILDEYGLADLTMRRLADALDVKPGAFYWHFANKQSLLAGVADAIVAAVPSPPVGPWRVGISQWAWSLRATILSHRDCADVIASSRALGLMHVDATTVVTPVLTNAGLASDDARACVEAILRYVLGHSAEEQAKAESIRLNAAAKSTVHDVGSDSFAFGLQLLLDGVAARVG